MNDNRRADWWVAKEFYDNEGLIGANKYQKIPLVDASRIKKEEWDVTKEWKKEEKSIWPVSIYSKEGEFEIVVCFGFFEEPLGQGDHLVLVSARTPNEDPTTQLCTFNDKWGGSVYCKICKEFTTKNDHIHFPKGSITALMNACGWGRVCLSYLSSIDRQEELIEKRTAITSKHHAKTAQIKPWLREDLPTIIPIKLSDVKRIRPGPQGGTHATPRPHQRRGNWATFRNPKWGDKVGSKVWRRPAWVGDKEWVFNGATYRVLL